MEFPNYQQQFREVADKIDRAGIDDINNTGSASNLMTAAFLTENGRLAGFARRVYANSFVQNATGVYLDLKGEQYGLRRRPALPAVVFRDDENLKLSVSNGTLRDVVGTTISSGTEVSNTEGTVRYVTPEISIPAGVTELYITASAIAAGSEYNVNRGELNTISIPAESLSVTNEGPIETGRDVESDNSFRRRLLQHVQGTAVVSGANLVSLALGIPGVSNAFITPTAFGINAPALLISGPNKIRAGIRNQVQAIVDSAVPFGTRVQVVVPQYKEMDLDIVVKIDRSANPGITAETVKSVVRQLFGPHVPGLELDLGRLDSEITRVVPGVLDVDILSVRVDGRTLGGDVVRVREHDQLLLNDLFVEIV